MEASRKGNGPAGARNTPGPGPQKGEQTVDERSLAYPSPTDEERGCFACYRGVVYIGHLVEEEGHEVEVFEAVPCRRCADRR